MGTDPRESLSPDKVGGLHFRWLPGLLPKVDCLSGEILFLYTDRSFLADSSGYLFFHLKGHYPYRFAVATVPYRFGHV